VLEEKPNATFGENPHKTVDSAKQRQMPLNNSHSRADKSSCRPNDSLIMTEDSPLNLTETADKS
jgi:hypothetical protein